MGGRGELAASEKEVLGVDGLVQEGGVGEKRNGLRPGLVKAEGHEGERCTHRSLRTGRKGGLHKTQGEKQRRD